MAKLTVAGATEVVIGRGRPSPLLPDRSGRERVAILSQPGSKRYALETAEELKTQSLAVDVIGLPDRDQAKTLAVAERAYDSLARFGLGRHDTVVGIGGGSVTDLAGFVAGTWLRGVEAVYLPTTLLAAVDASIGGKSGVNLAGKNLVGVFWHPSRVVIDIDILESLPPTLLREGLAEALKAGLIDDVELFESLETEGLGAPLEEVVTRAIVVKAGIVDRDERETGDRALLNLGHTLGHAIEFASRLSHGESVGLGLVAAARISESHFGFIHSDRVIKAVQGLGLPVTVTGPDRARVVDLLGHDKKRDAEGIRMVLLDDIGSPKIVHVSEQEIDAGLEAVGL